MPVKLIREKEASPFINIRKERGYFHRAWAIGERENVQLSAIRGRRTFKTLQLTGATAGFFPPVCKPGGKRQKFIREMREGASCILKLHS